MSFLTNLNSFFLVNEVAIVIVVAAAFVLLQLALVASVFWAETAVVASDEATTEYVDNTPTSNNDDLWSAYTHTPLGF